MLKSLYGIALAIGSFLICLQIVVVFLIFGSQMLTLNYTSTMYILYVGGVLSIGLTALAGGVLWHMSHILRRNSRPNGVLCGTFLLLIGTALITPWHSYRMLSEERSKIYIASYSQQLATQPHQHGALYYNRAYEYLSLKKYDNAWKDYYAAKRLGEPIDLIFVQKLEKASGKKATEY